MKRLNRIVRLTTLLSVFPVVAQAYVMGVPNPPTGQPETSDGVQITLPDAAPQKAMTEQQCIDSGEDCPKGYDWYLQTDYKIGYDLKVDIRYIDSAGETVAEGDATTWRDGNVGDYGEIKYASPTIAGFSLSESWQQDDAYDVALRYAGEFGAIRVAAGVGYIEEAVIGDYQPDPNQSYNAANNSFTGTPGGIAPNGSTPELWQIEGGYKFTRGLTLDLEYNTDGWYGRSQGATEDVDTGVYVAPTIQRPKFEIGLDYKFNDWDLYKSGYFVPTETFQIPADAGGGSLGTFVPGTPTDIIGGLDVKARYQLNNDFSLSGNYSYVDTQTGETQNMVGSDPSTYTNGFSLGGPIWKDKVWFFANSPCRQELAGTARARNKTHIRASAPSAEEFVRDPTGPRQLWNARYDGALPVVLDADAGPKVISEALTAFLNQAYLWFAPSDAAILLGQGSAAGQSGPAIEVDPEIENADDKCNGSKTVIKGPTGPQGPAIVEGPQGPSTQTRQPEKPCDCSKEQAAYDAAKRDEDAALKEVNRLYQIQKAAEEEAIIAGRKVTENRGASPEFIKDLSDASSAAWKRANKAKTDADKASEEYEKKRIVTIRAKEALDKCKAKCPSAGKTTGGTATPVGPQGPATTTGDKDKPCDCKKEQSAYDAADKAVKAAERALKDAEARHAEAKTAYEKADRAMVANESWKPFTQEHIKERRDRMPGLKAANDKAVKDVDAAYAARKAAEKALEEARITRGNAKKALDACKAKCPTAGAGAAGTGVPTGPQGPATTTGEKDKSCNCAKEQAAYDAAKKAEVAAEQDLRKKYQAQKDTARNASSAFDAYQDNGGKNPEALAPYLKDLEAANAAANAAKAAATKASEDYDKARVNTIRAKRGLDACKEKCGK
ncbi:MAG: hypothetical protein ACE363_02650 [Alphaproteobacteria bacterium]